MMWASESGKDHLSLKFGGIKSIDSASPRIQELKATYVAEEGSPELTERQKKVLCDIIDELNVDTVFLEWDERWVGKEEAKRYVLDYKRAVIFSWRSDDAK